VTHHPTALAAIKAIRCLAAELARGLSAWRVKAILWVVTTWECIRPCCPAIALWLIPKLGRVRKGLGSESQFTARVEL